MSVVIKVSNTIMKKMMATYPTNRKLPNGAVFASKITGVSITGYKSGKVLFQGQLEEQEAQRWDPSIQTNKNYVPDDKLYHSSVLGSDEVGTGSYFGPLTTAAVYVPEEDIPFLEQLGVKDSKKLSDPEIIKMAKKIIKKFAFHVVNIMPHDYNRLTKKYNQAQLKAISHNFVLLKVLNKIKPDRPDHILIDEFISKSLFFKYISGQPATISTSTIFKEKGEGYHLSVAAASIIARYYSLQSIDELSASANMTLPIGSGQNVDIVAAKLIKEGLNLDLFAKLHFANTKKAYQIAQTL